MPRGSVRSGCGKWGMEARVRTLGKPLKIQGQFKDKKRPNPSDPIRSQSIPGKLDKWCNPHKYRVLERWLGPESNRGHEDFQSSALPTELPSLEKGTRHSREGVYRIAGAGSQQEKSAQEKSAGRWGKRLKAKG